MRGRNTGVYGADGQGWMLSVEKRISALHNLGMLEGIGERRKRNELSSE